MDDSCEFRLPNLIEYEVPNERSEIPTRYYLHLAFLEQKLFPLDYDADISLRIGRDIVKAQHVE